MKHSTQELHTLRETLGEKSRDELNVIAKQVGLGGFSRKRKGRLIDELVLHKSAEVASLLDPSWWGRHHNHVYGTASIVGLILGVTFYCLPDEGETLEAVAMEEIPSAESINSNSALMIHGFNEPFRINTDVARRDKLLEINDPWSGGGGGIQRFSGISREGLEQLFRERHIDPSSRINSSPSAAEFLRFMQKHPAVTAHGFAVSPNREDYGAIVEGLAVQDSFVTAELKLAFLEFCHEADELAFNDGLRAWWD